MVASPIMITSTSASSFDFKGKKAAKHHRALYALEAAPSSPESSNISSDNEYDDEHYFSDISTGSSSTAASS